MCKGREGGGGGIFLRENSFSKHQFFRQTSNCCLFWPAIPTGCEPYNMTKMLQPGVVQDWDGESGQEKWTHHTLVPWAHSCGCVEQALPLKINNNK